MRPAPGPSADATIATDFASLTAAAATTRGTLQPLEHALDALAARRRAEAGDLGFSRARDSLGSHREALARFAVFAALVPSWHDLGHEAGLLLATVKPDDVDALAAAVGGTAGHDVGTALAAYRQAVGVLAAAAAPLRERLAAARDRDRLAGEARGGQDDPRYRQLVAQYGETLADASVYVPSAPPELHRPRTAPAEKVFDVALLWDEAEDEWFRLPGDVPVEEIFRDVFIAAGKRPTPGQLKYLAGIHPQITARRATVDALAAWLRAAATGEGPAAQAFAAAPDAASMRAALDEPWRLRARYVYDAAYRQSTLAAVDQVRKALVGQGAAGTAALRSLDALLDRHALTLESQWAVAVPPAVGTVRVTAWFRDDPKTRFVSTWRFDKEQVRIEIDQGRANGVRRGNMVETEGSIPGRNCVATDRRSFAPNGTLTFSASYRCIRDDGRIEVNDRIGAGTWEVVPAAASPDGKPPVESKSEPRREPARRPR
ncbi:hypothetical protein PQJ75_15435 [Rhodoplanes sp. TEM]|uniref:Uncharacterized protein n=1 Tax=Rhodoplanes tepidamans TaxID=200616 RepID=A0ABT5JFN7_RHOTP|nr:MULTISPECIES: hypothetical protein [Rhodoplanes]MDC7788530.1 hypothetical protein [Rhodoplanes tepidamans]MDC7985129.1 hypothetical protein [Rhodoplanes sp. TEM]MDQ0353411.1 hypothetical protein [Rhodoplanes tepidamans]